MQTKLIWIISISALILANIVILLWRNIKKREQAEQKLKKNNKLLEFQIELEDFISHLSTEFISLDQDKLDAKFNQSLQRTAELLKADRSYIFLFDHEQDEMNNAWEHCAPGIEAQIDNLQNLPLNLFPWVMERLYNLENIVIPDVEQLPPEAVSLKETLQAQEIKSAILVPITGREELIGFWGIDAVAEKKVWNNNISNLLKIIGEIFGNALQQNKYEAKLKRNQERLELSLWGANIGLWDWDVDTDQVQFNSQWARMFGYYNDNLERDLSAWKDMIHPEDKEETINKFEEHLAGETDYFESEHRMETKEGNWKWVLGRGRVVSRDKNNDPLRVVGVHVDITNKKELDNIKSDLISTVSHEIRTPLSSVLGFTELLLDRDLTAEKQKKYLEMIHRESNRLKNLINDFLDIQRIEAGNHQLNLEEIDLEKLIREVIELYEVHDNHQFIISVPDERLDIRADYNKIKQVVTNLVSNAVKYSPEGSQIEVLVEEQNNSVQLTVVDNGVGIAKDDQENLFRRFYRAKSSTDNQIEGTGLGLAICKKIIEAHQGEIGLESELERGSRFYFTIPNNQSGDINGRKR